MKKKVTDQRRYIQKLFVSCPTFEDIPGVMNIRFFVVVAVVIVVVVVVVVVVSIFIILRIESSQVDCLHLAVLDVVFDGFVAAISAC